MAIGRLRTWLYRTARLLGDYQAVRHGRVGQRLVRRGLGRVSARVNNRITNGLFR